MGKYCKLIMKAVEKGYGEDAWRIAEDMMTKLERKAPELYEDTMEELEKLAYKIPRDEAEQIVRNMRPKGQYWTYTQVMDLVKSKGIDKCFVSWYLVMNMMYNDYCNTAKMYGLHNDVDFYFSLAKDFIEDPDAKPMKVEKYFLD